MKILDNGVLREMTEEEVRCFFSQTDNPPMTETEQKAKAYDILMGVTE